MVPTESERRRTFRLRVDFERDVIRFTNEAFPTGKQLAGLTRFAVTRWLQLRGGDAGPTRVVRAAQTLIRLSTVAGLIADRSRSVFDPDPIAKRTDGHALLAEFILQLREDSVGLSEELAVKLAKDGIDPS